MPKGPQALLIRQKRLALGWSRQDLAKKADLSFSTIKNLETGRHNPSLATTAALAAALGLPELVGPQAPVLSLLGATDPGTLAELLGRYSVQSLVEALRLARVDLWALFAALFPVSAAAAQTMSRLDVGAMSAEQNNTSQ